MRVQGFKSANGRDTLLSGLGSAVLLLRWGVSDLESEKLADCAAWAACTQAEGNGCSV